MYEDSSNYMVEMKKISKTFGKVQALSEVDLNIIPGKIIGLVGPNGAGKSTLLRHMIGFCLPTSGNCRTFGCDSGKLEPKELSRIGYVNQPVELVNWMTVEQLIRYVEAYYPKWNRTIEEQLVQDFEITRDRRIADLSPGDRQKLGILVAVCFEPDLLILDEPASALDPIIRSKFLALLIRLIQQPHRTIIISSHILSDLEKVIDSILVMNHGVLLKDCGLDELRQEFVHVQLSAMRESLPSDIPVDGIIEQKREERQALITLKSSSLDDLKYFASDRGCEIQVKPLSLDEIYRIVVSQRQELRVK